MLIIWLRPQCLLRLDGICREDGEAGILWGLRIRQAAKEPAFAGANSGLAGPLRNKTAWCKAGSSSIPGISANLGLKLVCSGLKLVYNEPKLYSVMIMELV